MSDPPQSPKKRASRNRTLTLSAADRDRLQANIVTEIVGTELPPNQTLQGNCLDFAPHLPQDSIDLLILDPPYNLNKTFNGQTFVKQSVSAYTDWLDHICSTLKPLLKPSASIYICGDWFTSTSIFTVAHTHFHVRNRITWEREKGRGARSNWKNASEDIWFCTASNTYTFNCQAVKQRRKVLAPYRHHDGSPKDWVQTTQGNFRDTYPSNLWTDISIPFWSMPENTDHPTQKSEKLLAKLVLASSNPGDLVLDPFLGSGTTSVVAKKLGRQYWGIDINLEYCLWAERRLELADADPRIQGLAQGIFWERNTVPTSRLNRST
ncbi:site-specific DNA-methyltransferase [Acaryochloris sp. IP29b_bin.148]|uniref:DNA-methyltransferase n=1 Tax=Acaryochloris sp. IP29b_bin.148 TaxID=2969218 RepID=UPI00263055F1|nr:site-specific DNA-methyltransferase [Acaryochloris sp. IP29b_bin.148]